MRRLGSTVGVNVATIGLYLLASVAVARTLGADGRGAFAALMSVFLLSIVVADVGQNSAVTFHAAREPRRAPDVVVAGRRVMLLAGVALVLVAVPVVWTVPVGLGLTPTELTLAVAACLVNALAAPYVFAAQALAVTWWNALRLLQPLLYVVTVLACAAAGVLSVEVLVLALVGSVALALVAAWAAGRRLGLLGGTHDADLARQVRRYGFASYAAMLPLALVQQGDRLVLVPIVGAADVGRYAVALSVVGLTAPLVTALASLRFPEVAGLDPAAHGARAEVVRSTLRASTAVVLVGTVGAVLAGSWLVPVLFGPDFAGATWLLWLLAPLAALRSVAVVTAGLLRGLDRPGVPARAQLAVLVVAAVLLVPSALVAGLAGAAVALLLAELVGLVVCLRALGRTALVR